MATEPIPKFWGQIDVVTGVNDRIDFWEVVATDTHAIVAAGTYWPDALATAIETALNAVTAGWTVTVSDTTGIMTITRGSGWYPKITTAQSDKLLTGGDTNIDTLAALAAGERAPGHCGWNVDTSVPSQAVSHSGDLWVGNCYFPEEPPAEDPYYKLKKEVRVSTTPSGAMYHADYSGQGKGMEFRPLRFEYQTEAIRLQEAIDWWKWYASGGGLLRYFPDRTDNAAYKDYKLTEESCTNEPFDRQMMGYAWYAGRFTMQRVWS